MRSCSQRSSRINADSSILNRSKFTKGKIRVDVGSLLMMTETDYEFNKEKDSKPRMPLNFKMIDRQRTDGHGRYEPKPIDMNVTPPKLEKEMRDSFGRVPKKGANKCSEDGDTNHLKVEDCLSSRRKEGKENPPPPSEYSFRHQKKFVDNQMPDSSVIYASNAQNLRPDALRNHLNSRGIPAVDIRTETNPLSNQEEGVFRIVLKRSPLLTSEGKSNVLMTEFDKVCERTALPSPIAPNSKPQVAPKKKNIKYSKIR